MPVLITNPGADAELAIAAVQAGAAIVRDMFGDPLTRFEKPGGDFATNADLAAEKAICDFLRASRPDDAVTGEESGRRGRDDAGRRWLVDPLCGTVNYAAGNMLVAVNVALRVGTDIAVAASADPFTGEVFWTDGTAAYLRGEGGRKKLRPSADSRTVDINLDPPFPNEHRFRAAHLLANTDFIGNSGHGSCPPHTRLPGSPPGAEPPMSQTGTCATACTSPAALPCVKRRAAS